MEVTYVKAKYVFFINIISIVQSNGSETLAWYKNHMKDLFLKAGSGPHLENQ